MSEYYILLNSFGLAESDAKEFESVESALGWMEETARELRRKVWLYSVNLVAESEFIDYQAYIRSDEWREKADAAKERAGYRCQVCNSDGRLDAHHRTYDRLGNEQPEDITVLCRDCHSLFHGKIEHGQKKQGPVPDDAPDWMLPISTYRKNSSTVQTYPKAEQGINLTQAEIDEELSESIASNWEKVADGAEHRHENIRAILNCGKFFTATQAGQVFVTFEYPVLRDKFSEKGTLTSVLSDAIKDVIGQTVEVQAVIEDGIRIGEQS